VNSLGPTQCTLSTNFKRYVPNFYRDIFAGIFFFHILEITYHNVGNLYDMELATVANLSECLEQIANAL